MRPSGWWTTTFSLVGRCERTGMVGMAIATRSICVGSRCVWVRASAGAVGTQNLTDPRLGILGLDLLARGYNARAALEEMVRAGAYPEYRQLLVVDCDGHSAVHSGERTLGTHRHYSAPNVAVAGNLLASDRVVEEMARAFENNPEAHLAERLLRALEAGKAAGGEVGGERSANLVVAHRQPFPLVDMRVDDMEEPIRELRRLWGEYEPLMSYFTDRACDPRVPSQEAHL